MEWLLIAAIIAAAVLPIAWVMPSKRQRYETRQRLYAMKLGFQVSLKAVPMTYPKPEDLIDGAGRPRDASQILARYAIAVRRGDAVPEHWHVSRSHDVRKAANATPKLPADYHWRDHPLADDEALVGRISAALTEMPDGVVALERKGQQLAAFWDEAGNEAGIDQLRRALEPLI